MSLEIFEKFKDFLIRLVKDEAFRSQLMSDKVEEVRKALEDGGYNFSQEEFETSAIKILELKESGEFDELSEEELLGAFGGITSIATEASIIDWNSKGRLKPLPRPFPKPWPKPCLKPCAQPMYGIIVSPIDPPIQAMYGVIVSPSE
jgi:predicted ribosomally synthesized peptide with nif11-like leader